MLQGVQAECGDGGGVGQVPDPEDATFLPRLVVVLVVLGERFGGARLGNDRLGNDRVGSDRHRLAS